MSVAIMTKVWGLSVPAKDKLILLALADWANDEGLAWPSIATLAQKCGCDERTVQRNLRKLEEAGHLRRELVPGKGCRYWVLPPVKTPGDKSPGGKLSPVTKTTKTPGKLPPNTSRNTINGLSDDKPKRARKPAAEFAIPDWMPAEAWAAFIEMRRENRKAPTDRAAALLVAQLDRWRAAGHDPSAILNQSTMHNWTGLYEPKDTKGDRHHDRTGTAKRRNPYAVVADRLRAAEADPERGHGGGDGFTGDDADGVCEPA